MQSNENVNFYDDSIGAISDIDVHRRNRSVYSTLEAIKARETALSNLLDEIRKQKLALLKSKQLKIGIIGFGRFGQFIAESFIRNNAQVVATSRSDYTEIASAMGAKYIPLSDPAAFLNEKLDVILFAVSITSFEKTVDSLTPFLQEYVSHHCKPSTSQPQAAADLHTAPLLVDVLSVKEHPRKILLDTTKIPEECDILCTHPMFGPDSGKDSWNGLNFVYERTRINKVVLDPEDENDFHQLSNSESINNSTHARKSSFFHDLEGKIHSLGENNHAFDEGMDRMERFLSIWEEEGCKMVRMSCKKHDEYAANSQFITHLTGRILGGQGLSETPIDTKGFQSVLKLVETTTSDSFDLFYGLYKYNQNSVETILNLRKAMDNVIQELKDMESQRSNSCLWHHELRDAKY